MCHPEKCGIIQDTFDLVDINNFINNLCHLLKHALQNLGTTQIKLKSKSK